MYACATKCKSLADIRRVLLQKYISNLPVLMSKKRLEMKTICVK